MADLNREILLKDVTINHHHLFKPSKAPGYEAAAEKYSAEFLLHKEKNKEEILSIQKNINNIAANAKSMKLQVLPDKLCLRDGETKNERFKDYYILTAKADAKMPPKVIDRKRDPVNEHEGLIYNGCIVNGLVNMYYSKLWKGITAELKAVQYVAKGEHLGGYAPVDVERVFEALEEEEIRDIEDTFTESEEIEDMEDMFGISSKKKVTDSSLTA